MDREEKKTNLEVSPENHFKQATTGIIFMVCL